MNPTQKQFSLDRGASKKQFLISFRLAGLRKGADLRTDAVPMARFAIASPAADSENRNHHYYEHIIALPEPS